MRDTVRFYCFDDNSMDGDGYSNLLSLFADLEKSGIFVSRYHEVMVIHITAKLGERRVSYGIPMYRAKSMTIEDVDMLEEGLCRTLADERSFKGSELKRIGY